MRSILLVEDDSCTATLIQETLSAEGFRVVVENDGESGLDRALRQDFDLILLDVVLPKKDGYTICKELRSRGHTTPVLMLTHRNLEADQILGLAQGADDYVTKPFSSRVLIARINARLRQVRLQIYKFGDYELDENSAELRKSGIPVPMTKLELKLLVTFCRNSGRVLSRDRLLDLVWGTDKFPTEHAVDNHITSLRRKIESNPQNPTYLINVPGFGYRFDKNPKLN